LSDLHCVAVPAALLDAVLGVGVGVDALPVAASPVVVGLAGAVAAGKSTLAAGLARELTSMGRSAAVLSTDCFLLPNDELGRLGLGMQKGFPPSYDAAAMRAFVDDLARVRSSAAGADAGGDAAFEVPVYSHEIYDRVPGATQQVGPADVIIIEGVNALQPPLVTALDVAVYLDVDDADVSSWYIKRFLELIAGAEIDETSFYRGFVGLDATSREALARSVWDSVNAVNLRDHIAPTRAAAHLVIHAAGDHSLT